MAAAAGVVQYLCSVLTSAWWHKEHPRLPPRKHAGDPRQGRPQLFPQRLVGAEELLKRRLRPVRKRRDSG